MAKFIFVGDVVPKGEDERFKLLGKQNFSSAIYNQAIISGFKSAGIPINVYSCVGVGHFPMFSKTLFVRKYGSDKEIDCVGYCNLVGVNSFSKTVSLKKRIRKSRISSSECFIIVSEASLPFIKAALYIKKKNKKSKIVLICLDIPENVNGLRKSCLYQFLKYFSNQKLRNLYKEIDGFVYLSKSMNAYFNHCNVPYKVLPCVVDLDIYDAIQTITHKGEIWITYCGTLSLQFDIDLLLKAFSLLTCKEYRLILAGGGDAVPLIKKTTEIDDRIVYLGCLSREGALSYQKSSDVLVNPRLPSHKFSSESFPSKTVNYLLTFKPVVSYVFSSFPKEIAECVLSPSEETAKSLSETIDCAVQRTEAISEDKVIGALSPYSSESVVKEISSLFKGLQNS